MDNILSVQLLAELVVGCGLAFMLACFVWLAFDTEA